MRQWLLINLQNVFIHAFEKSQYYFETFHQAGINPYDMIEITDLQDFPLIIMKQYRNNIDKIISRDSKKNFLIRIHTGGTNYRHAY
ncbi:MAG TPA: hypothetical protein VIK86_02555 [Candidatus Paceibacterota bacterium]